MTEPSSNMQRLSDPTEQQQQEEGNHRQKGGRRNVVAHYTTATLVDEKGRLEADYLGKVEKARTLTLLKRYLPQPPAKVADIGGAAGAYSFALAEMGYEVHLVDLTPLHIEQAKEVSNTKKSAAKLRSMTVGDARDLGCFPDRTFGAVLEMGPLYHQQEQPDRMQVLGEANRVLKPGGLVFCAAISKFASFLDGLARGFLLDDVFVRIVEGDLATGKHNNPTEKEDYFTTAYFHHPDDLKAELRDSGFQDAQVTAVEGPLWAIKEGSLLRDDDETQKIFKLLHQIETEPAITGMSPHLVAVGTKGVD